MAKNLGKVTAYGYAKAGGYTGTEEEFTEMIGNLNDDATSASASATAAANSATQAATAATTITNKINQAETILDRTMSTEVKRFEKKYSITSATTTFTFSPTGYTYTSGDRFEVYVNGLKLAEDAYTNSDNVITITDGVSGSGNPDIVEILGFKNSGLNTDTTLSISGAAADAKVTGDEISSIKDDLRESFEAIGCAEIFTDWEQGTINYQDGTESSSTTTCRTDGYFVPNADGNFKIVNDSSQTLGLRIYDTDGTYNTSANISTYSSYPVVYGKKYRLVCGSTGTPSAVTARFFYPEENTFPEVNGKIAHLETALTSTTPKIADVVFPKTYESPNADARFPYQMTDGGIYKITNKSSIGNNFRFYDDQNRIIHDFGNISAGASITITASYEDVATIGGYCSGGYKILVETVYDPDLLLDVVNANVNDIASNKTEINNLYQFVSNQQRLVNWHSSKTTLAPVSDSTTATCLGISFDGEQIVLTGKNTASSDGYALRTLLSYELARFDNADQIKNYTKSYIPLVQNHKYKVQLVNYSGSLSSGEVYINLRDKNSTDRLTVKPTQPVKYIDWTYTGGAYLMLWINTQNQEYNDYAFDVIITDITEGVQIDSVYSVATGFTHETVLAYDYPASNSVAQGFCTDGTYLYQAGFTDPGEHGWIRKIDASGNVVAENLQLGQIGHMNQITYDPKNRIIYSVGTSNPTVQRINPDNLELLEPITLTNVRDAIQSAYGSSTGFWAIAYDSDNEVFLVGNNRLYCVTNNDFTIIYKVVYQKTYGSGQGIMPFGDIIYASYAGQHTYDFAAYDRNGKTILTFNTDMAGTAEFEGACVLNGELYVSWNLGDNKGRIDKVTVTERTDVPIAKIEKQFNLLH